MRFAWHKLAEPNLANKEGLPAAPFRAGEVPERDWLALKVDEAKQYKLIYDLDLANLGGEIKYTVDASKEFGGKFDRIAYFLELQKFGEETKYAYASMDAFTDDVTKIGIPTFASKAVFQQHVDNMNVISNVQGIATGVGLKGGKHRVLAPQLRPQQCHERPQCKFVRLRLWRRVQPAGRRLRLHAGPQLRRQGKRSWRSTSGRAAAVPTLASATARAEPGTGPLRPVPANTRSSVSASLVRPQ